MQEIGEASDVPVEAVEEQERVDCEAVTELEIVEDYLIAMSLEMFGVVEQLCRDQNINAAYDLIEHYSEFILLNISYIRRNRDCPNDISEAVSSLIYASARCGDLPELLKLRKLFGERYGQKLSMCATELLAGNRVNDQIIDKLSTKSIADDVKYRVLRDIGANNSFQVEQPKDDGGFAMEQHQVGGLLSKNCEWQRRHESIPIQSHKPNHQLNAGVESTVQQIAAAKFEHLDSRQVDEISSVELEKLEHLSSIRKSERIKGETSECSSNLSDRSTIYANDIEEFKPRIKNVADRDQRLFRFNSTPSHLANNHASTTVDEVCLSDQCDDGGFPRVPMEPYEVYDGKTSSRASSRRRKSSRKRLRRRCHSSVLLTSSAANSDHVLYYGKLVGCSQDDVLGQKSHPQRKYRKKMSVVESPSSSVISHGSTSKASDKLRLAYYLRRTLGSTAFQRDMDIDCFLKDVYQIMSPRQCSSSTTSMKSSYKGSKLGAVGNENSRRQHSTKEEASMSSATSTNCRSFRKVTSGNQIDGYHEMRYEALNRRVGFASRNSCSSTTSPSTRTILKPPYLRAMTMPVDRPKAPSHQIIRSISCASQQSNHSSNSSSSSCSHVHPKLPDYNDLAIRFKALKEERKQNSRSEVCIGLGRA
ncbi:hypothetical protein Scep_011245 [Stephania cephalantha]|uniref:Uncharacterized protein n=1 Tax=Stephania cephalantha TaxID=152367 RepID=A0AAP0JF01_9MAGN